MSELIFNNDIQPKQISKLKMCYDTDLYPSGLVISLQSVDASALCIMTKTRLVENKKEDILQISNIRCAFRPTFE